MEPATIQGTLTTRDITRRLQKRFPWVRLHHVRYAIDQYDIQCRSRIGIIRLWAEDDLSMIMSAVKRCAERKGGR